MRNDEIILIASGDLRVSANQTCWPAQAPHLLRPVRIGSHTFLEQLAVTTGVNDWPWPRARRMR